MDLYRVAIRGFSATCRISDQLVGWVGMTATIPPAASPDARAFPGFWAYAWMFFMQPQALHACLSAHGIDPRSSFWRLHHQLPVPAIRAYVLHNTFLWLVSLPVICLAALGLHALGYPMNWSAVVGTWTGVGLMTALLVLVLSVTLGILLGCGSCLCMCLAVGLGHRMPIGPDDILMTGAVAGMGLSLAGLVCSGLVQGEKDMGTWGRHMKRTVGTGLLLGLLMSAWSVFLLRAQGTLLERVALGGLFLATYVCFYLRLPLYPLEVVCQRLAVGGRYRLCPLLYHELCHLPLPGLYDLIVHLAAEDPPLARALLAASTRSPGNRGVGARVMTHPRVATLVEARPEARVATD